MFPTSRDLFTFVGLYKQKLQQAALNWGIVLLGMSAEKIGAGLALILIARKISPIYYGQYVSSYSLVSFMVIFPSFGMDLWLITRGKGEPGEVFGLWKSSITLRVRLLIVWIASLIVIAIFLPAQSFPKEVMLPTIFGFAFDSLSLLTVSNFRRRLMYQLITYIQLGTTLLLIGIAIALPGSENTIVWFAYARMFLSFVIAGYTIRYNLGLHKGIQTTRLPDRTILAESSAFFWSDVATSVYVRSDLIIISLIIGASGSSIYAPAINILQFAFLAPRAIYFYLLPILANAFNSSKHSFTRVSVAQTIAQAAIGIILSLAIFFLASWIIPLVYSTSYLPSISILKILSPIPFFRGLNFALGSIMAAGNKQLQRSKIQALSAITNLVGNLIVIVPFGIPGVAWVYTFSELILVLGYVWLIYFWAKSGFGENRLSPGKA